MITLFNASASQLKNSHSFLALWDFFLRVDKRDSVFQPRLL